MQPSERVVVPDRVDVPLAAEDILALAERAVRRIDRSGHRGVTRVSTEEIAAMACLITLTDATGRLRARLAVPVAPLPTPSP